MDGFLWKKEKEGRRIALQQGSTPPFLTRASGHMMQEKTSCCSCIGRAS